MIFCRERRGGAGCWMVFVGFLDREKKGMRWKGREARVVMEMRGTRVWGCGIGEGVG